MTPRTILKLALVPLVGAVFLVRNPIYNIRIFLLMLKFGSESETNILRAIDCLPNKPAPTYAARLMYTFFWIPELAQYAQRFFERECAHEDCPDLYLEYLATGYRMREMPEQSLAICDELTVRGYPRMDVVSRLRGIAMIALSRYGEAVLQFRGALQQQPDCAEAEYGLGYSLYNLGQHEEAQEHFYRAAELSPYYAEIVAESRNQSPN